MEEGKGAVVQQTGVEMEEMDEMEEMVGMLDEMDEIIDMMDEVMTSTSYNNGGDQQSGREIGPRRMLSEMFYVLAALHRQCLRLCLSRSFPRDLTCAFALFI